MVCHAPNLREQPSSIIEDFEQPALDGNVATCLIELTQAHKVRLEPRNDVDVGQLAVLASLAIEQDGAACHNMQYDCDSSKSLRTMTKLSGGECHNHTMKRVGCDPHAMTSKRASLKRRPSGHMRANIEKCHDAIEEDDASSNPPPRKVGIEDMLRHKQDKDIRIDMKDNLPFCKAKKKRSKSEGQKGHFVPQPIIQGLEDIPQIICKIEKKKKES